MKQKWRLWNDSMYDQENLLLVYLGNMEIVISYLQQIPTKCFRISFFVLKLYYSKHGQVLYISAVANAIANTPQS